MKKLVFQIHLWIGLVLCVLLGLTGSYLVFADDLEKLTHARAELHASGGAPQSLDVIAAAALAGAPKGARITSFLLPETPADAAALRIGQRGGARGGGELVKIDPANLRILSRAPAGAGGAGLAGFIHRLHANLLMDGPQGRQIIGWFGVAMCILGCTGLVLWWPRRGQWRRAFAVGSGAQGYRFNRDLHGATGIWMLLIFLAVSFSGIYLAFPEPMAAAIRAALPGRDLRGSVSAMRVAPTPGAPKFSFDQAAALARRTVPDGRLMSIAPAPRPDQPVRIGLAPPGWREGAPFITIYANPYTDQAIEVRDPRRYTVGETLQAWLHAVHAGEGLGLVWKILVFLVGLAPAVFTFTGVAMWLAKRKARAAMFEPEAEIETV